MKNSLNNRANNEKLDSSVLFLKLDESGKKEHFKNYSIFCFRYLCEDIGCSPEDLPEAINDREKWRERVRDIRAGGTT